MRLQTNREFYCCNLLEGLFKITASHYKLHKKLSYRK